MAPTAGTAVGRPTSRENGVVTRHGLDAQDLVAPWVRATGRFAPAIIITAVTGPGVSRSRPRCCPIRPHDSLSVPAAMHLGPCRAPLKTDPKPKSP